MPRFITSIIVLAIALAGSGCGRGDGLHRTKGRLTKGGEDFIPPEGEYLQISLTPITRDGKPPKNIYFASVDQDAGTFTAAGPLLQGVPAGKYRISVELMKDKKDQFAGRFDAERSPFVFDIDGDDEEIVVDLDSAPPEVKMAESD
jgi:hypothetical protein